MISKQAHKLIALVSMALLLETAFAAGSNRLSGIQSVQPVATPSRVANTNRPVIFSPDQLPFSQISSLTRELVQSRTNPLVRIRGQVLDQGLGEYVVLQDGTGSILAETRQTTPLAGNEYVTASGRIHWDGTHVFLSNSVVRPVAWDSMGVQKIVPAPGKPDQLPVLTQVRDVRDLPPSQAAWKYPVHVRGVLTTFRKEFKALFLQDETAGIFVSLPGRYLETNWNVGDQLDVEGVSGPGGYAPIIESSVVKVVGRGKLPVARLITLYQMATGQFDSQWIEVRGTVRSAHAIRQMVSLELSDLNGLVEVNIPGGEAMTNLTDSLVRVRGVCGSRANLNRQLMSAYVWAPSTNFVSIEENGAADPFAPAAQPIASLSEFTQRRAVQHRLKIAGVVTFSQPGRPLFVQDETGGVPVYLAQTGDFQPGDRVEVAGYLSLGDFGYVFRNAMCRVIGHTAIPNPKIVPSENTLRQNLHSLWVQLDARLVGSSRRANEDVMTLQSGNLVFEALRPSDAVPGENPIPPVGSLIQLQGVYSILGDESRMPRALRLYVPQSESIRIMEKPDWWNTQHASTAVGAVVVIGLIAALWAILLRRRVAQQTRIIRDRLEKEASLEQRYREIFEGANDLIFTLEPDGRITSLNPAGQYVLGYNLVEVKNLMIDRILAPGSRGLERKLLDTKPAAETANRKVTTCECEFLTKSGRTILTETSCWLMLKDGKPHGFQAISRDITERKRAEEALQQSEVKFRSLVEQSLVGVYVIQEGRFAYINPRMAAIFGYQTGEMLQSCFVRDVVCPEDRSMVEEQIRRRISGETTTMQYKFRGQRKDGSLVFVEVLGNRAEYGGRPAVMGTLLDISERNRAEAALAEASSLLETLLENSPDCIYFKDIDSRLVRYSQAFVKLFRVTDAGSLRGKTDFDFFTEEHARPALEDEQEIIRTGKPLIGKLEKETYTDGRVTWCLTTKMPWRDKDGRIIGTFGISKDVTAIKKAEEKLAYERLLFHALVENLPDAIYFKDRESHFVRLSRSKIERSRQILIDRQRATHGSKALPDHLTNADKCAEYLAGKTDFDVYQEDRARASFEEEQQIIRTGQPVIGKFEQTVIKDNETVWYLTTKMPWCDEQGNIIGTFGVSRDITALKDAEAKLATAHQRLLETSRLAGMAEVATDVLHNVGNVLNSVNVSCSLTIDRVKASKVVSISKISALLNENQGRLGEFFTQDPRGQQIPHFLAALSEHLTGEQAAVLSEMEQLVKHIDHIKQIVVMQQSYAKVAGVLEAISPDQLVEDALHINGAALARHDVRVRRDFEETPQIMTEKHKVLQILVNLIRNAKYAMDEVKQPDKLLTIKVANDGANCVKIEVIDTGIGIPQENLTRIFSHGFTTRRNGHGFGLHSSALAVRDLGGSLQAHSDGPGKGAVFTLLLPLAPPSQSQPPA